MIKTVEDLIKALEKLDKKRNIVTFNTSEYYTGAYFIDKIITLKELESELEENIIKEEGMSDKDYVL